MKAIPILAVIALIWIVSNPAHAGVLIPPGYERIDDTLAVEIVPGNDVHYRGESLTLFWTLNPAAVTQRADGRLTWPVAATEVFGTQCSKRPLSLAMWDGISHRRKTEYLTPPAGNPMAEALRVVCSKGN